MAVKRTKSGSRLLATLEHVARSQPIGVSELARLMEIDKSALQRTIMTLADEGWIQPASGTPRRWQLTGHIQLVAHMAHGSSNLRQRAMPALLALREATSETVALIVPDIGRFVVVEVMESRQLLRSAPHIGMEVASADSATGRAVLPWMPRARRAELLGGTPTAQVAAALAASVADGYAVREDELAGGSINVAAPVFEADGVPAGAVTLSAPHGRLMPADYARVGMLVRDAARRISLTWPAPAAPIPVT